MTEHDRNEALLTWFQTNIQKDTLGHATLGNLASILFVFVRFRETESGDGAFL